jgi:biopolymer transport protein ExbB
LNVNNADTTLGVAHFLMQSDAVGKTLLAVLIIMSVASWAIIVAKALGLWLGRRRSDAFLSFFWNATSMREVAEHLARKPARDAFSLLSRQAAQALAHHQRHGGARLQEAGTASEFVTRTIKKVLDETQTSLESGLTVLATVGATAPFVGLFGTVWGVYHALVAIGMSGAGTLDKVAGPVGEALIMTGLGLAVAIPAVMGYNALTRAQRVLMSRLDAFAYELHTFVCMGQPLGDEATPAMDAPGSAAAALHRGAATGHAAAAADGIRAGVMPVARSGAASHATSAA